jgi:hypothetical protein
MTDPAYTHIVILADRTSSMGQSTDGGHSTRAEDITKGVSDFIADQADPEKNPGRTTFSLVQFNDLSVDRIAWFAPGDDKALRDWKCQPYGSTPLLDAMGRTIEDTGEHLAGLPEDQRPGHVYFVTGTDGEENRSREFTKERVRTMITHQQDAYGWEFVFLGAGIDAFGEAGGMGIRRGSTMSASADCFMSAYASTSSAVTRARTASEPVSYTQAERDQAAGTSS